MSCSQKKNARICLINPPSNCVENDRVEPPLGLLYIAANLRDNGFRNLEVCDMTGCKTEEEIAVRIAATPEADIYGISSFSTNYGYASRIAAKIKARNPNAYIVIGGAHPTGAPKTIDDVFDLIVKGEGDDAFLAAVQSHEEGMPLRGLLTGRGREKIDSYPFPARELVDLKSYSRTLEDRPVISLQSSRGCKHKCMHCNSVVMGGGKDTAVRYRSPKNIIKEMEELRGDYSYFRFNDDHFTGNPDLEELLKKMKYLNMKFRVFARIEDLDMITCGLLKDAGCTFVSVGLESMNYDNLKVLGKTANLPQPDYFKMVERNLKNIRENEMVSRASFMVGLPHDTDRTIEDAFKYAGTLSFDEYSVYSLIPYPGTILWERPEQFDYTITEKDFTKYVQMGKGKSTCYVMNHRDPKTGYAFTGEDVRRWKDRASEILDTNGKIHMSKSSAAR